MSKRTTATDADGKLDSSQSHCSTTKAVAQGDFTATILALT